MMQDIDINKEITRIHLASAQIYLRRVELQTQQVIIQNQIQQIEAEMLRLDGELRLVESSRILKTNEVNEIKANAK